jgi:hypothetical protein
MKLHTKLDMNDVYASMLVTQARGLMAEDVFFYQIIEEPSRTHQYGFKIQLGTWDQRSGPKNSRNYKQMTTKSGKTDDKLWAATYEEWGWFLADIFDRDPDASFGHYKTKALFHEMTKGKFRLEELANTGIWVNVLHP